MEDKLEITGSSGYKTEITNGGYYMASDDYNLKSVNYMPLLNEDYLLTLRSEGSKVFSVLIANVYYCATRF